MEGGERRGDRVVRGGMGEEGRDGETGRGMGGFGMERREWGKTETKVC